MAAPTAADPTAILPTEFITRDLPLAAWLRTEKQKLLDVRTDGSRALFVFEPSAEAVARRFWEDHRDVVLVKQFHKFLRELRGMAREALA